MNKKKILFITPSCSCGGTNSSLSSIYNTLCNKYDIQVLTIMSSGVGNYDFLEKSFTSRLLNVYYGDYVNLSGIDRIIALVVKIIKRISIITKFNFESIFLRYVCRYIEKKYNFDFIVGFQENLATYVASFFHNSNKIAWVHCDYERAVSENTNELPIYDKFNKIVCVSNYTREKFINRYPKLQNKTYTIYNLLDTERIISLSTANCTDSLFSTEYFSIISAGRMDPVKRFTLIPQIAKKIVESGLNFRWYILGGPNNLEMQAVKKAISIEGVEDYVILLGNKSNPYPYFKKSNIYVCTSISEACPMVFNEARLFGLPIITANFGSAYEFVDDMYDGIINDINRISEAIIKIILNREMYSDMKIKSSMRVIPNDKIINDLEHLFNIV